MLKSQSPKLACKARVKCAIAGLAMGPTNANTLLRLNRFVMLILKI